MTSIRKFPFKPQANIMQITPEKTKEEVDEEVELRQPTTFIAQAEEQINPQTKSKRQITETPNEQLVKVQRAKDILREQLNQVFADEKALQMAIVQSRKRIHSQGKSHCLVQIYDDEEANQKARQYAKKIRIERSQREQMYFYYQKNKTKKHRRLQRLRQQQDSDQQEIIKLQQLEQERLNELKKERQQQAKLKLNQLKDYQLQRQNQLATQNRQLQEILQKFTNEKEMQAAKQKELEQKDNLQYQEKLQFITKDKRVFSSQELMKHSISVSEKIRNRSRKLKEQSQSVQQFEIDYRNKVQQNIDCNKLRTNAYVQSLQNIKVQKEEAQRKQITLQNLLEQRENFAENVRKFRLPKISRTKQHELQALIKKTKTSSRKQMRLVKPQSKEMFRYILAYNQQGEPIIEQDNSSPLYEEINPKKIGDLYLIELKKLNLQNHYQKRSRTGQSGQSLISQKQRSHTTSTVKQRDYLKELRQQRQIQGNSTSQIMDNSFDGLLKRAKIMEDKSKNRLYTDSLDRKPEDYLVDAIKMKIKALNYSK